MKLTDRSMNADEQQIRDVIQKWIEATALSKLDTVLELMTEDVVFFAPGREPLRGREAFASACRRESGFPQVEGTVDIREVTVAGDLAICWSRIALDVMAPGEKAERHRFGDSLSMFKKDESGRWRLHRDANLIPLVFAPFGSMSGT